MRAPSRSFSRRCHSRVRSRTSWSRVRVRSRRARADERGLILGAVYLVVAITTAMTVFLRGGVMA